MDYDTRLTAQQARAQCLVRGRRCPHCDHPVSELDLLSLLRGHGSRVFVPIVLADGTRGLVPEGDFNPQTMLWDPPGEWWCAGT